MSNEITPVVAENLLRRACGSPNTPSSKGMTLYRAGFVRLALVELRRVVREAPIDPRGWLDLLEYFLAENLLVSALATLEELEGRGPAVAISPSLREVLARFSAVPPISLYVPCFNAAESLPAVLESVHAQSIRPAQVVVVDDASTDATAEVVARFRDVEFIRHSCNRGVGATRNTALAAVRHPLVASLDSDVIAGEFWLERLVVAMVDSPLVGAFGALVERNAVRLPDRWRARVMPLLYPSAEDIEDAVLYGSNTLFTTAALRAVGGYDPRYTRAFDDTDLGNKLRAAGLHIRYVHRAVCEHTRRDSMLGVLSSCYAYRKERALKERLFDRLETLEIRWNTLIRDGIAEIEDLRRTGAASVVFPSFLNIFWTIARDLEEFLRVSGEPSRRMYAAAVLAAIDRAIGDLPGVPESVGAAIRRSFESVRVRLEVAAELCVVTPSEVAEVYERCFAKVGVVLCFSPAIQSALERGALETLRSEDSSTICRQRLAVVDCGYLLGNTGSSSAVSPFDRLPTEWYQGGEIQVASFERSTFLRDPRQRAAALEGFRPSQVILNATGEDADRIACSYLRLLDWCGDLPPVIIAGTSVSLDELPGVEFTVAEPARVVDRILSLSRG